MDSLKIRQMFLEYFKKNGHTIVSSSSLIPAQDPTLLFANAGMNQFKDIFLGKEKREYTRATTIQKCVRAGGKHNDLDQVGFTARHLTFFEMMGNFSFGDYFKKEAIEFAWNFLTQEVKIPKDKLHITIYKTDDQAYEIWNKIVGIPPERIVRLGEKDNFWQMGDTGPCGPCTEIHFDRGSEHGCNKPECALGCNCDRFLEIWNLVFMQYNKLPDGSLQNLVQTGVDTGMGLERLCMVLQGKNSVFEIDSFQILVKKIEILTDVNYSQSKDKIKAAFHVLSDHVRSSCLLIADGCTPSNEGRGYVLRKIIRRAALFAQKITDDQKLFIKLAQEFINNMSGIYPELKTNHDLIINLLDSEIERFSNNLIAGQNILEKFIEQNIKDKKTVLSGEQVFKLYDTYGFPPELTRLIAQEKNFDIDFSGFETEMKKQQEQSGKKETGKQIDFNIPGTVESLFVGYNHLEVNTEINFIYPEDKYTWVATKESPFYVESGGQVSDTGWFVIDDNTYKILEIRKVENKNFKHVILCKIENNFKLGTKVKAVVDYYNRINTAKNHTATHLLQTALTHILGSSIKQAGSFVDSNIFRFDFTYHKALTDEQVEQVETLVNQKIQDDLKVQTFNTTLQTAKEQGVTAFFGEKYNPENVRVVKISDFSAELCGGTHASNTGIIGAFKIIQETSLSAGVRRITGVTGPQAIKLFQKTFKDLQALAEVFKVKIEQVLPAIQKEQELISNLNGQIRALKKDLLELQVPALQDQVKKINNIPFLFLNIQEADNTQLKNICSLIEKKAPGFYFIVNINSKNPDQINYFGYLSKSFETIFNLKEFSKSLANGYNLRGGGSSTLIQGGGTKPDLNQLKEFIIKSL